MRRVIDTQRNKSQLLTVIGMALTLLLSSCNNSPNNTTNAEASQKTQETGKLLPISEGNYWEYKHEAKDLSTNMTQTDMTQTDFRPSRIEVDNVEETSLKEKLASFTYYGIGDRSGYFDSKKKYNIKNNKIRVEPIPNTEIIFKTGSNSGNYSYTINNLHDSFPLHDKVNVNVSYQQQQVSVPAGEFKGVRYDFKYDLVKTEKSQTPEMEQVEQTFVLVKNVGVVYHKVIFNDSSFKSLLTDYNVSDKK